MSTPFEKETSIVLIVHRRALIEACLEIATKLGKFSGLAKLARALAVSYAQSIIGATEKRRDSGAGVAVIGGIGIWDWGMAERRAVYQD